VREADVDIVRLDRIPDREQDVCGIIVITVGLDMLDQTARRKQPQDQRTKRDPFAPAISPKAGIGT